MASANAAIFLFSSAEAIMKKIVLSITKPALVLMQFIKSESASGVILFIVSLLAIVLANSSIGDIYQNLVHYNLGFHIANQVYAAPIDHWINDGLMTIFFLLVGLEIKREILQGELNQLAKVSLPLICAVGGMLLPALIYLMINHSHPEYLKGWAIPTATDIAFALAAVSLLGNRVPISLKIFLVALAIFDDIGAIAIIGIFYTEKIHYELLLFALITLFLLWILNYFNQQKMSLYLLLGVFLWWFTLKSGIHATLAGVMLAFTIPLKLPDKNSTPPLKKLEKALIPWVSYLILPLFGFVNAGVSLAGMHWNSYLHPLTLGILLGLFLGKQIGIFSAAWLAIKLKFAKLPENSNWLQLYGIAIMAGIGFTMSLFIGNLAFEDKTNLMNSIRLGVLSATLLSCIAGYLVLRFATLKFKDESHVCDDPTK